MSGVSTLATFSHLHTPRMSRSLTRDTHNHRSKLTNECARACRRLQVGISCEYWAPIGSTLSSCLYHFPCLPLTKLPPSLLSHTSVFPLRISPSMTLTCLSLARALSLSHTHTVSLSHTPLSLPRFVSCIPHSLLYVAAFPLLSFPCLFRVTLPIISKMPT